MDNTMKFSAKAYGRTIDITISDESTIDQALEAVIGLLLALSYTENTVREGIARVIYEERL